MTRLRAAAVAAALLAPLAAVGAAVSPAGAQASRCSGIATQAAVTISAPAPNATVSGTVTVRGTASTALVGSLDTVEVTFGRVTQVEDLVGEEYSVSFDTRSFPTGLTSIRVVACGTLARGEATRTVNVQAPAAPTTTASAGGTTETTLGTGATTSVPSTTTAGQPTTTAVTPTTTASGATTTTASSAPSTTAAPAEPPVVAARSTTTRPDSRADAPLVLTEAQAGEESGTPLWVGAVVGISGGLGLLFSAVSWRRRANLPEPVEPVDPELVDV